QSDKSVCDRQGANVSVEDIMGSKNLLDKTLPALILKHGNAGKNQFTLDCAGMTLGRDRCCDIQLDAVEVSGVHCVITRCNGLHVRDCKSRVGTHLNGERIHEAALHDGDVLQIGAFSFEVYFPAPATADDDGELVKTRRHLEMERLK